jgi:hypothetical protein
VKLAVGTWPVIELDYPIVSGADVCESIIDVLRYLNLDCHVVDGRLFHRRDSGSSPIDPSDQYWHNAIYLSSLILLSPDEHSEAVEQKFSELCNEVIRALEIKLSAHGVRETHLIRRYNDEQCGDTIISFVLSTSPPAE